MGLVAHPQRCSALKVALPQRAPTAWHAQRPLRQCASRKALRSNARKSQRPGGCVRVCAAALADAGDSGKADTQGWLERQKESVATLLTPFSDSAINAKLLALCSAQVRLSNLDTLFVFSSDPASAGHHIPFQLDTRIERGQLRAQGAVICAGAVQCGDADP